MITAAKGIDISSWQHPEGKPIDWAAVRASGVVFAIVKATQGTGYTNPWLREDLTAARKAGVLVGAYHYWEEGLEPTAQAEHFIASLVGEVLDLGAWLDFEPGPATPFIGGQFVTPFKAAVAGARGSCGLYCDESWAVQLRADSVPLGRLWLAAWSGEPTGLSALITQGLAETVPGVPAECDTDAIANVRSLNLATAPPPPPPPAAKVEQVAETAGAAVVTGPLTDEQARERFEGAEEEPEAPSSAAQAEPIT